MILAALCLSLAPGQAAEWTCPIPGQSPVIRMRTLPALGKDRPIAMSVTEIPHEVLDIWALRLDEEQLGEEAKVISRPSKPYAVIFTGFGHDGFPANCISFHGALKFCDWLSKRTKRKFRLPTQTEWIFACKANEKPPKNMDDVAWHWDNAEDATHPIGKKKPNGFGLFDMYGNVGEWATKADGSPVLMGGSWRTKPKALRADYAEEYSPDWNMADPQNPKSKWWLANGQFVGLRLVCELEE
ncbi:MAG: SUMF1/EgtB/PvdO family nonheme iron enzyme [Chthonomonas sp.]|nr:SUMF1/EgtB/PvdO family nonheme iron enzyme [Chthonomonas sp.]